MHNKLLVIATRKSPLALWQANHVRQLLLHHWPQLKINLLPLETSGDRFLNDKLLAIGNKGLFLKELETALLDKRADLAVHSMKDMPATLPDGLKLAAIGARESPWDALVSNSYNSVNALPLAARIGTASLRRQAQLLAVRPDLQVISLRGNVNSRIQKMTTEGLDAIILAAAGLIRLEFKAAIKELLGADVMLPACGQGALGIECRTDDLQLQQLIAPLNDTISALCVHTERAVNAGLGGHCHTPVAIFCEPSTENTLQLRARVLSLDGQTMIQYTQVAMMHDAEQLAADCVQSMLMQGAANLLAKP